MPMIMQNKSILSVKICKDKNLLRHQGFSKENKKIDVSVSLNKNSIEEALQKLAVKLEIIYGTDDFIINFFESKKDK